MKRFACLQAPIFGDGSFTPYFSLAPCDPVFKIYPAFVFRKHLFFFIMY